MAGRFSDVNDPADDRAADFIRVRVHRIDQEIERLQAEKDALLHLQKLARFCSRCGGGGTICETRTEDDSPWYEPCPTCQGKGHRRDEA